MSRKRVTKKAENRRQPVRVTALAGKEAQAQKVALALVVATVLLVFVYALSALPALRWAAVVTAVGAVAASAVHFIERGRRSVILETAFRSATEQLGQGEEPHSVRVDRGEGTVPAILSSEGDRWFLEVDDERIEYVVEDQGAMAAWPDYRLADFASQLARRNRMGLRCCATCTHFGHSRVSRMTSRGWVGYCTVSGEGLLLPERDAVHIWHLCKKWERKRL